MVKSILVVCMGNICRSPTGERLLQHYCPQLDIHSAGLGALVGHAVEENARLVAEKRDLCLADHHARQLTSKMCFCHDLILVMEKQQINGVSHIAPEVRGKTMLFGHWIGQRDIPDPYRRNSEVFEFVYALLDDAARQWANALNR
ncbi:protein tyrosine phosphatase [Enterobacteriaceae bacterium LUAb1]